MVPTPEFSADDGWVSDVMTHIKESEHLSEELAHDRTPVLHDVVSSGWLAFLILVT